MRRKKELTKEKKSKNRMSVNVTEGKKSRISSVTIVNKTDKCVVAHINVKVKKFAYAQDKERHTPYSEVVQIDKSDIQFKNIPFANSILLMRRTKYSLWVVFVSREALAEANDTHVIYHDKSDVEVVET